MSFWTSDYSNNGVTNPKRNFRFKVQFSNNTTFGTTATDLGTTDAYWAKTAQKPGFSVGSVEHAYLNHTFKFPGRVTWNDVQITMVDPGGKKGVGFALANMLKAAGYAIPADETQLATISKTAAVTGTGTVIVTQLDPEGAELETWTLYNAFITEASFGQLDYGSEELTEYSLTLKYDWAEITTDGAPVRFSTT
jgi:hypothetical protein